MLFAVRMDVEIPHTLDPDTRAELVAREKEYCRELQKAGVWIHILRCAGQYANLSILKVTDGEELHHVLWNPPSSHT